MPDPLDSPSWEMPGNPHLPSWLFPSSIISWSLRGLAVIPAKRWWGVPPPTLPHSHTGTRSVGTAGQQLGIGARLSPQPTDLREGMRNRAIPQCWKSSVLIVNLGTNKACKLDSNRPFPGNLLTGMYSGSP